MKASLSFCIASMITLTSCASVYPITYNSVPQGAVVVCGPKVVGTTPVTVYMDTAKHSALVRSMTTQDKENWRARPFCSAHWASGSTASFDDVPLDPRDYPNGTNYIVNYPGDANARAIDEARAMQTQQMQLRQQQVQLQQPAQQPAPIFQPPQLPNMPSVSPPSAPGRTTTVCRTLSNGTIVCD